MRVLYHHRIASKDGQFVHIEEICNALRKLKHEVVVVGPKLVYANSMGEESRLVKALKKHLPGQIYEFLEIAYSLVAYFRLSRQVSVTRPDFLYERYSLYMLAGVWLKRRTGIKYVLEINSPLAEERANYGNLKLKRLAQCLEGLVWRNADIVLPVSKVLAKAVEERGVAKSKIRVIHNGANLESVARAPSPRDAKKKLGLEGKIVLGFVGFVREWHALDRVVKVLSNSEHGKKIHLLVVGQGPALTAMQESILKNNSEESVTFTGAVQREHVLDFVAAFDIALQPDVVPYASPLKIFDYMAMGKAIVAPDSANIREILSHMESAMLFSDARSESFEDAVLTLVREPELRDMLGRNALALITSQRLDWKSNAEHICELAMTANC